jgi:hypothetical protein
MNPAPSVHVEFFVEAVEDKAASRAEGRPIFKDTEFVRIRFPGDMKRELVERADVKCQMDKQNGGWINYREAYPRHYEAFLAGRVLSNEGTPIEQAPFLTASQRAELKAVKITTVEALASVTDGNVAKLGMGGRAMREQARAYIDAASSSAGVTALAAENADMKAQLERLMAQMAEMQAEKRGPGRPRKTEEVAA